MRVARQAGRRGRVGAFPSTPAICAVAAVLLVVYLATGAKVLNLDGLGYAGRVESGSFRQLALPGHLLYAPLMSAIYRLAAAVSPGLDAARLMQVCGAIFAAVGVGVLISALRRLLVDSFVAIAAGLALGFSYTYWTHATDLTTYALSTLCLICAFHRLCAARQRGKTPRIWLIGAMVAFATLIHQSNVAFLPAVMLGVLGVSGTRSRYAPNAAKALKLAAISLALVCLAYIALGWAATGSGSPVAIAKWAAGGAHGYPLRFEPLNLARGVYGFANAVIYLDNAGTAIKGAAAGISGSRFSAPELARFAGKAVFLALTLGLPLAAYARGRRLTDQQRWAATVCIAWIVPYALVALLFFTTDHDRWIMLMPAVVTLVAVAHPRPSMRGKLAAAGAVAILFSLNLTSALYPAHLGVNNRYYQEAVRLAPRLASTDMIVFWGHDHIGTAGYLHQFTRAKAVHVVDLVVNHGKRNGLRELTRIVRRALASNRRVLVIGLYGSRDTAGDYRSEAHALDLTRPDVIHALSPFAARPLFCSDGCRVYQLNPAQSRNQPETSSGPSLLFPIPYSLFPYGGSRP